MQLISICVYDLQCNSENETHANSPDGILSAEIISSLLPKLKNIELPQSCIYTARGIYFYLQCDNAHIYLLSSRDDANIEVRSKHFKDVREIVFKQNYREFAKKIDDPDYFASKFIQTMQNVSETRSVVVTTLDKVLERGGKIEEVLKKTEQLEKEAISFKTAATNLNRNEEPFATKAKRAFCCLFPWCNNANKETEPLLKRRNRP